VDGVAYLSRFMGTRRSVVLFERCAGLLGGGRVTPLLKHADFPGVVRDFRLAINRPRRPRR
jgi:hypothetical protein